MQDLLLISNRLPVTVEKKKGRFIFKESVGGLATGLGSFYKRYNSKWIGWCGLTLDTQNARKKKYLKNILEKEFSCHPVFLSRSQVKNYYNGFCNKTIWPILLYFPHYVDYNQTYWNYYKSVNKIFSEVTCKIADKDDLIWIHDYHLMLLPGMIREKMPEAQIGFFLRTPFPSFEIFRLLPWREELLKGLLGADLIGFHTYDYVRHFLSSVNRLLGYDCTLGKITTEDRTIQTDTFPIGIDYKRFSKAAHQPSIRKEIKKWQKRIFNKKVLLSVDRLDYTKGIPQRLEAFGKFLDKYPEYRGKVIYILLAVPSRQQLDQYKQLKRNTDELVGSINGKYGSIDWMPVWYLYRSLPFNELVALYNIADIGVVSSLRDGMNLVAKEYLATRTEQKGVLILSETAGSAKELGEAIIVNPNNLDELVEAFKNALSMPESEQIRRTETMQNRLQRFTAVKWAENFLSKLQDAKKYKLKMRARILKSHFRNQLIEKFTISRKRLFLLDYDGTLVPFYGRPEDARPDKKLLDLLAGLSATAQNKVVIISGRDRNTLDRWFRGIQINMIAEHGGWIKETGHPWKMIEVLDDGWKTPIRPVLESYEVRTPGSILEEKTFSLVWHYRQVDTELALRRVVEIIDDLSDLSETMNLQIARGEKVLEVKKSEINKGRAAMHWTTREDWDFIIAIGDSWTDEDLFRVLPEHAYSIKVGLTPSQAKYNLESPDQVINLLTELAEKDRPGATSR